MRIIKGFQPLLGFTVKRFRHSINRLSDCIVVHPQVEQALKTESPVVALETAVLTHGMPHPFNLQNAFDIETIIKQQGAVPATIGILGGKIHVGLTEEDLHYLSKSESAKVARRDLPFALAKKLNGGTTVSGTMAICERVGIPIFVTGGIGGVHRGAEESMDVSSDLTELGRTPVTVISAGVKSILDVGRTLEVLETQGVCVSVVGDSLSFPDFFTRDSGFTAPCGVESCLDAAHLILSRKQLDLQSGILLAVPIPREFEADGVMIKNAIDQAIQEANVAGVQGRHVTPFVLRRVNEITEGKSLVTNLHLLRNNAKVGAQIAVAFSKLLREHDNRQTPIGGKYRIPDVTSKAPPVVIGGSIVDVITKLSDKTIDNTGRTHKGSVTQGFGGVGRNVTDVLTKLDQKPLFISALGKDQQSQALLRHHANIETRGLLLSEDLSTACYNVLLDHKGEVLVGVGDMEIHEAISINWVEKFLSDLEKAPLVVLDGNVPVATIAEVLKCCREFNTPVWFEPTDVKKATKPWLNESPSTPDFISPNLNEFNAIIKHLTQGKTDSVCLDDETYPHKVLEYCHQFVNWNHMIAAMVTFGTHGFMILRESFEGEENSVLLPKPEQNSENRRLVGLFFDAQPMANAISVSGAGDCLASGFIAGMLQGEDVDSCAAFGLRCAHQSLQFAETVPASIKSCNLPTNQLREKYKLITL